MRCEYTLYRLNRSMRNIRDAIKKATKIRCKKPATRFFMSTHPNGIKVHPNGQQLCDEHFKQQQEMDELYAYLDTPAGRRELFD